MVKWTVIPMVLFALCISTAAWATRVDLVLLAPRLEQGQVGAITVRVIGARPTAPPRIQVQPAEGIALRFERQGQQVNIVNSKVTRLYEYTYRVQALKPGVYTIGPADIEVGTQHMLTGSKRLVVTPKSAEISSKIKVSASFSVTDGYAGQVVIYERSVQSRQIIAREEWTTAPIVGLVPPRDGEPKYQDYKLPDEDGITHFKSERRALLLAAVGERAVPAAVARLSLITGERARGPFAMRQTRLEVVGTEPSTLNVLPLPPAPAGFSGLVGDFTVQSSLDRDAAAVGETVRQAIILRGDGALDGFSMPKPDGVTGARLYDGSPATTATLTHTGFSSEGRYERVIVPTEPGELRLPTFDLITFSPTKERYVTVVIPGAIIDVRRGKPGSDDFESFAGSGDVRDTDTVYVEQAYEGVRDVQTAGTLHSWWMGGFMPWVLLIAGAPIASLGLWQGQTTARKLWRDRPRRAKPVRDVSPLVRLKNLPAAPARRLDELDAALRHALARYTGVDLQHLDRQAAAKDLNDELSQRTTTVTLALDRARFAGAPSAGLEDQVVSLVRDIERQPRSKK